MKKTLLILLFTITANLVAEEGIWGYEWNTPQWYIEIDTQTEEIESDNELTILEGRRKIGIENKAVYYFFIFSNTYDTSFNNGLNAVATEITDTVELEEFKTGLKHKYELKNLITDALLQEDKYAYVFLAMNTEKYSIDNYFYSLTQQDPEAPQVPADGILNIYDYNSDTRVYIFENFIKNKALVVYVPHEWAY